ncbi:MAG: hypothetical protein IID34_16160 [Planctomycetes bacterium]|nr:hypothetical protein [Planctomycetota bacterium]
MALTANQEVDRLVDQELRQYGVTAGAHIYKGGFVGLAGDGYAQAFVAGNLFLGLAYEEGNNTSGADGDVKVRVSTQGDFELAIASLAITDIGAAIYGLDDATATLNPDNASYIGYVVDFVSSGVGIVRLQTGNLVRGQGYTAVGEVDCETGQTPSPIRRLPCRPWSASKRFTSAMRSASRGRRWSRMSRCVSLPTGSHRCSCRATSTR